MGLLTAALLFAVICIDWKKESLKAIIRANVNNSSIIGNSINEVVNLTGGVQVKDDYDYDETTEEENSLYYHNPLPSMLSYSERNELDEIELTEFHS